MNTETKRTPELLEHGRFFALNENDPHEWEIFRINAEERRMESIFTLRGKDNAMSLMQKLHKYDDYHPD